MSDSARKPGKIVRMPTGVSVFGPFRFESRTGRLTRGEADIHLTPRASAVLRCLIAHRGGVVSKDALFAEVWKDVSVTDDALLQVVSAVRKALGDDPRDPEYVQTITGEGYCFIAEVRDRPAAAASVGPAWTIATPGGGHQDGVAGAEADKGTSAPAEGEAQETGLPPTLVGEVPTPVGDVTATPGGLTTRRSRWWRNAVIGLVLVTAVFVTWALWSGAFDRWSTGAGGERSIAVLPFVNMTGDPANEYFSDGLAEELVSVLGRVDGLRVAARTSSFMFKGQAQDIDEIGRRLNVATILEGSARKEGDQVRITATLVDVEDGFELWTATYDRQFDDVFAIQQDIAEQVAAALTIPLMGDDAVLLVQPPTDNVEAYEAYLQGKYFLARYTGSAFRAAARNFERATQLDEGFALAYVGLADAYLLQHRYGVLPLPDALAAAEPAIEQAMELDDRLGEAYSVAGLAKQLQGDTEGAEVAYARGIELDPGSARTYQLYWWMLFNQEGNTARTRALAEKALLSDPLSPAQNENFGWPLFEAGRFDEALVYFERSVELEPAYPFGHSAIGVYHQSLGHMDQAIASFEEAVALSPETVLFRTNLGKAYAAVGRTDEAIEQFATVIESLPGNAGRYADVGEVFWDARGRPDQAVGWYEQATEADAGNARLRAMLALVYLDLSDEAAAERWVNAAAAVDPDNTWAQVSRLNLIMYADRYAEGAEFARELASTASFMGYLAQFDRPYTEFEPLGYFGVLAGEPADALVFPTRAFPALLEDDPVINRFNVNAAIDLAAVLKNTGDDGRAELLLSRSLEYIESQPANHRRARYREEPVEIYALRGMVPEALAALRSAIDHGWRRGWWRARHKPHYEALRAEPEFQDMLRELEAEAARMRAAAGQGGGGR